MEIHRTAHKHGIDDVAIRHAVDHALVLVDLEPDSDPPSCSQSDLIEPGT